MSDETNLPGEGAQTPNDAQQAPGTTQATAGQSDAQNAQQPAVAQTPAGQQDLTGGQTLMGGAQDGESKDDKDDSQKKAPEPVKTEGAPEEYGDFNAPEGIELAGPVMDEFKGVAKELNLSQEQAQSLIDRVTPAMQARAVENIQRVSREWAERSKNDAEIGGSNYQATQANVWRVISNFGRAADGSIDPDVAEFINSPMGNHPGALKLIARAGAKFGEAKIPTGSPAQTPYTPTDFYNDAKRN